MSERKAPTNDPETDADPRVLALLQSGTPANGIDLAPWWRAHAESLAAPRKPKPRPLPTWASFAAVFLVGIALGFVISNGRFSTPASGASPSLCRYTENERSAFSSLFASAEKANGVDRASKPTAMLTLCSSCHVGASAPEPVRAFKDPA